MTVHISAPTSRTPYDPAYDPLVAADPGVGRDYAPTYWVATAGPPPPDDGPVAGDMDVDVAIIGSGFTGLATALFLAREHGIKAHVLEANAVAWGCTSRNGGQAQLAAGRLYRSQWAARWGLPTAKRMHAELLAAWATFEELIATPGIDCEPQRGGHLYVAHRPRALDKMAAEARFAAEHFDYRCEIMDAAALARNYLNEAGAAGAMHEPHGIGVHPLKLAFGYLNLARAAGARVHPASPVQAWHEINGVHHLRTPGGTVRARAVAVATGGYTSGALHPLVRGRFMPILSNSLVTRPLTAAEKDACGFRTREPITDSRTLRHYYRLLPDDRVQIGSRSAITGRDASNPAHLHRLVDGLHAKFPALRGVEIEYSWWGWVDVSHDMMPRIVRPDPGREVFYAFGYGGNGVMYSAHAGRRMAALVAGRGRDLDLPILASALPRHPFAPFRRLGQWGLYRWYHFRDERP